MVKSIKINKKSGNSDNVHAKKSFKSNNPFAPGSKNKRINPFEIHINREKFNILGRTCRNDKGLPGVSRAKAVQKRKQTIGKEFLLKNKANQFKDRRIGRNSEVIDDNLLNARFLAEKVTSFKRSIRFNLNDNVVLTHRGQTLEEIEQYQDDRSDDDLEDDDINGNFTEAVQFGGEDSRLDRKNAIEEIIVEAKRRKAESAKEKEEIFELTKKLDHNYKDLIQLVGNLSKPNDIVKPKPDEYDRALREMIFEPRGAVCDRLKSEEEIARTEMERLKRMENERLIRMRDIDTTDVKQKHRSADDLDDGYFAGSDGEEPETLTYSLNGDSLSKETKKELENDKNSGDENNEEDEEKEVISSDLENNSSDESDEDVLSDLKDSESEFEKEDTPTLVTRAKQTKNATDKSNAIKVNSNIPFAIGMPLSYEELYDILHKHSPKDQGTLVERIIKCNHPTLEPKNKEKLNNLFAYLLQYIHNLFTNTSTENISESFQILDKLNPFLYDLLHINPEKASVCLLNIIQEKYSIFKKNNNFYPSMNTLVFFKIISNLFTTSDYRHNLVTPCFIFISHILSKARVRTRQDVAKGLFLVTLLLEYFQFSHRFVPAAFNFLLGVICLAIPKRPIEVLKIVPPFVSVGFLNRILAVAVESDEELLIESELLKGDDLVTTTLTTDFKIRALNAALRLTNDAIASVAENVGSNFLAQSFLPMLERIDLEVYPKFVRFNHDKTVSTLLSIANKPLKKLIPIERKPKALRLFEPRIEKVYDDKRRPKISKAKEEKVKLIHKIRRETKGAVREIRRDTEFLQKIRINQQIQSDLERKEKVKRIYMEASVQQGELNELSRKKKKI